MMKRIYTGGARVGNILMVCYGRTKQSKVKNCQGGLIDAQQIKNSSGIEIEDVSNNLQ